MNLLYVIITEDYSEQKIPVCHKYMLKYRGWIIQYASKGCSLGPLKLGGPQS
jgi:hypothetical protein